MNKKDREAKQKRMNEIELEGFQNMADRGNLDWQDYVSDEMVDLYDRLAWEIGDRDQCPICYDNGEPNGCELCKKIEEKE